MNQKKNLKPLGITIIALLLVLVLAVDVTCVYFSNIITRWWSGTFTTATNDSGYTQIEVMDNAAKVTQTINEEGTVLLKNNGLLPMDSGKHTVALLGYASWTPTYTNAGSVSQGVSYLSNDYIDFYDGFAAAGFKVDETMKAYYAKYGKGNTASGTMDGGGWQQATGVNDSASIQGDSEVSVAYRTALEKAAAAADTAVIVFSRIGAEGGDVSHDTGNGKHYLQFQDTEIELIDYAVANFDNVIVLINASHPMQLGELDQEGVDAALWMGHPGSTGIQGVADIIAGYVNPSGRLPDIYAYDLKSAPSYWSSTAGAYANYDAFKDSTYTYATSGVTYTFNNKVDGGVCYDVEGIYIGYRYYETAAAEGYIDYDTTVQYPFGYGLSYTTFDWEVVSSSFGQTGGTIEVQVKVTNTGDVSGKDVVELYFTAPYYKDRGIEKSHKVLGAFAKTSTLKPGESETVTLTMNVDDLASYDYKTERCYVADEGTYLFNLQTDSHNVKVNGDGNAVKTLEYKVSERRIYREDGVGARSTDLIPATNQFDISSNGDGNIGTTIPYVSRADFAGTHPSVTMGKRLDQYTDLMMGDAMIDYMVNQSLGGSDVKFEYLENYVTESLIPVEVDADYGLTVDDLAGYDVWDDPIWDQLVNQLTVEEMVMLISDSAYNTPAVESIGKGMAVDVDGPAGISSANLNYYGNCYNSEPVMAATWNTDLVYKMGQAVGKESVVAGISGWYAPGANTHRTPFNGRTGEYYAEDPLLAGKMCAASVAGAKTEGLYVYAKHFVCNDQDAKRGGQYVWINEQELREIQLKAFEYAIKDSGASLMMGYNRVGPMENAVCYALNTTVLKNEWGYKGASLTDGYSNVMNPPSSGYNDPDLQLIAGTGQLLFVTGYDPTGAATATIRESEHGVEMLHDMCKRILYRHCNSNAMSVSRDYTPYWIGVAVAVNVLVLGICALVAKVTIITPKNKAHK